MIQGNLEINSLQKLELWYYKKFCFANITWKLF